MDAKRFGVSQEIWDDLNEMEALCRMFGDTMSASGELRQHHQSELLAMQPWESADREEHQKGSDVMVRLSARCERALHHARERVRELREGKRDD